MREIKFRGKSIHSDKWCYGNLSIYEDDCEITGYDVFGEGICDWNDETVDPDTVGQYTGLKDKNGNDIYEGDIVKAPYLDPIFADVVNNMFVNVVVGYNQGSFVLEYDGNLRVYISDLYDNIEIIGNVHDNPELLKEE